ncbi:hypothetical protein K4K53_003545 [Colletotrichum sp. SAR 10_77]|nr:hypothetical protein K4K53_003545 [Colletotrichum sp. SAR 10_77]
MDRRLDVNAGFKLQARKLTESIDDLLDREKGITNDLLPILWRVNRLGDPMADDQSYKRARDAVFKPVFRNWNTSTQVCPPNPTRERHLTDTTVHVGWLAEDAPALAFTMVDENGSVFPNSIVVTHVPDYYLPRLRTEATMKWDDAE